MCLGEAITKSLLSFLLVAAVGYGLLVALMYVSQRALLYPGATGGPPSPTHWGDAVTIETHDGERLHALRASAAEGRPTVVFFPGNADRIERYSFLAEMLGARGIGLLALSYRGYPGSTGQPSEEGLLADGLAAFDWLAGETGGPVILLGQSLGSGVAVHLASQRPVASLVLISAYDSVQAVAQRAYFFLPVAPLIKDPFRSDLRIANVPQPKLFIHGRRDTVIGLSHGEALFAAAPEPKHMMVLDAYGHNDIWTPELAGTIADFIDSTVHR